MTRSVGLFDAVILGVSLMAGAALRLVPVGYGLPFVFHADETFLITELGKFLGGAMHGNIPFGISTFHYPLAVLYAGYFGVGTMTGHVRSIADIENAFLLDDPALHLIGRVMAAVFSIVTIGLTFLVGREVYSQRVGAIAALLTALCLPDISGAHWLKQNSIVTMMTMVATLAIVRESHGHRMRPVALGMILGLVLATRIDLAVVVPLFLLTMAVERNGRLSRRGVRQLTAKPVLLTLGVAAAVYLAVSFELLVLVGHAMGQQSVFATRGTAASVGEFLAAGDLLVTLRHNAWFYLKDGLLGTSGIVITVLVVAGTVKAARSQRREELILLGLAALMLVQLLGYNMYGVHYFARFTPVLMIVAASAGVAASELAPERIRSWCVAALVAVAAAQPAYYSVRYVRYVATNTDTRVRARAWIYQNIPFGTAIAAQKFDELPRFLPPLNESREFTKAKLDLVRGDRRGSGLALEAKLTSYPEDTYTITNLSTEQLWRFPDLPLENNYDFDRLRTSGVKYVITTSYSSPLMDEEAAVQGLLISPSALNKDAFARYDDFMRRLHEQTTLAAEFTPSNPAVTRQTDSPIDPVIRIYRVQ